MVTVALFVRLEAKPGKEKDVEQFLRNGLPWSMTSHQPRPGSASVSAPRPSVSLMPFPTRMGSKRSERVCVRVRSRFLSPSATARSLLRRATPDGS